MKSVRGYVIELEGSRHRKRKQWTSRYVCKLKALLRVQPCMPRTIPELHFHSPKGYGSQILQAPQPVLQVHEAHRKRLCISWIPFGLARIFTKSLKPGIRCIYIVYIGDLLLLSESRSKLISDYYQTLGLLRLFGLHNQLLGDVIPDPLTEDSVLGFSGGLYKHVSRPSQPKNDLWPLAQVPVPLLHPAALCCLQQIRE